MNALLFVSLWLALIMSSCCGNVGSRDKEELTTAYYDDHASVTPTPDYSDYDYNATFDYYYVTMAHNATNKGKEVSEVMITQKDGSDSKVNNSRNAVSGIARPTLVLSLGMAALQLWN